MKAPPGDDDVQEAISVMSADSGPPVRRAGAALPVIGWIGTLAAGILLWIIAYSLLG